MSTHTSPVPRHNERASVVDAIEALRRAEFRAQDLMPLSDLSRSDARVLERAWPVVPLEARIAAVRQMVEIAEDRIDCAFGRALRIALNDASPIVRQLAVDGLWEDNGRDLIELFLEMVRHDDSIDVRAVAIQGMARFADEASQGDLDETQRDVLRTELTTLAADVQAAYLVRRRALESVAAFGSTLDTVALISEAYSADDPGLRAGALYSMGRSLDRRWLNVLLSELTSPDAEMRYEAARACGEIGDSQAVPDLVRCVQDSDAEVRQAAIAALGKIGSTAALRALQHLFETANTADQAAIEDAVQDIMGDADL